MTHLLFLATVLLSLGPTMLLPLDASGMEPHELPECRLLLRFGGESSTHTLQATATVIIPPGQRLTLGLPGLNVEKATLGDDQGRMSELPDLGDILILPSSEESRVLEIDYTKQFREDQDNVIQADGIALTRDWHPQPDKPVRFSVVAELPPGFSAITEADTFPLERTGERVSAIFSQPTTSIHFVAGPYQLKKRQVRQHLDVHALFFPEDADLADVYLASAVDFLRRYEQELGPFPYNHYAIVANRLPSGLGIPTFSLFGRTVLRLPFIKDTSLGHEIVHSWFGNGVEVAPHGGNWCEGLTAYLSDHRYREDLGEGVVDRHESISRYHSYVDDEMALPLDAFFSADHRQNLADAKRAVGYQRGALLFHELREKIGSAAFSNSLRQLVRDFRFRKASWQDLEKTFSDASAQNLARFFEERLTRTEVPGLLVSDVELNAIASGWQLSLVLKQTSVQPFLLQVPIAIESPRGAITVTKEISEVINPLTITLDHRPTAVTIDPNHDFLRQLSEPETAPTWSRFLGGKKRLAVLAKEQDRERYQPLLEMLGDNVAVVLASEVSDRQLGDNHLLFLGLDQRPARALFGPSSKSSAGLTLDVRRNPLAPRFVAVLLDLAPDDQNRALLGRLGHYGKYCFLAFDGGVNIEKRLPKPQHGIRVELEQLPTGAATSKLSPFAAIVEQLTSAKVIYIGETHTSYADHLLQLRIIEALHRRDPRLVIGMEMFPATVQEHLDRYLLGGDIGSENEFLKASRYFQVWRYDYRLYRDILTFAREKKIRVLGLNLEQAIVSRVFREGTTETLEPEVRATLPIDRDLDLPGYTERLRETHGMHETAKLAAGSVAGFLQAQVLWDETMAERIADFSSHYPDHRLIVLAGRQHTRKDNGIPPRVARRLPVRQASVVNAGSVHTIDELDKIADFYFLSPEAALPEAAKIGVTLEMNGDNGAAGARISGLSPHGKAGAAGLAVGDVLLTVNGQDIADIADVQLALIDARPGDSTDVRIRRQGREGVEEHAFSVVLTSTPPMPPHP